MINSKHFGPCSVFGRCMTQTVRLGVVQVLFGMAVTAPFKHTKHGAGRPPRRCKSPAIHWSSVLRQRQLPISRIEKPADHGLRATNVSGKSSYTPPQQWNPNFSNNCSKLTLDTKIIQNQISKTTNKTTNNNDNKYTNHNRPPPSLALPADSSSVDPGGMETIKDMLESC